MWRLLAVMLLSSPIVGEKVSDLEDDVFTENIEFDPNYEDDFDFSEGVSAQAIVPGASTTIKSMHDPWGRIDIVRNERSISVLGGSETIASLYHASLFPQAHFMVWNMAGNLGVPLRFPIYDNHDQRGRGLVPIKNTVKPRDFRTAWDLTRVVRHIELGTSSTPYLVRLSRSHALTLGNGELVKEFSPDYLYDVDQLFLSGRWQFEAARVEGLVGPIAKAEMLGASLNLKPLNELALPTVLRNLDLGVSYINDFKSPNKPITNNGAMVLTEDRRLVKRETGIVQGLVVSVGNEMFMNPWLSLRPYTSFGQMWASGVMGEDVSEKTYGLGAHVGNDLAIYFVPNSTRSVLLAKVEGRVFSQAYWPGYFGSSYAIDRLRIRDRKNHETNIPLTKSQLLSIRESEKYRLGYLVELGYSLEDMLAIKAGYESAHSSVHGIQIIPMRKLNFTTSIIGLEIVKIHFGLQATSLKELNELFDFDESRALLSFRGQVKLSPYLYFDAWAKHSFGVNDMYASETLRGDDDEPMWLSNSAESKSLNFGLGLEFAMTF